MDADSGSFALLGFALAYAAVVAVPGPNFIIVSQASLANGRAAVAAVLGVAGGASLCALVVLSGAASMAASDAVRHLLGLAFAAVLVKNGVQAWIKSRATPETGEVRRGALVARSWLRHLCTGFLTATTNPMTAAFFAGAASQFACGTGLCTASAGTAAVLAVAVLWFGAVAFLFSRPRARRWYLGARTVIDRCMAVLLVALGAGALIQVVA